MAEKFVNDKVTGKKVMVFSKTNCSFCAKAKTIFKKLIEEGVLSTDDYEVLEIENDPNCGVIQDCLLNMTGARSVPRVFINGKCIGGGDDTEQKYKNGILKALLA